MKKKLILGMALGLAVAAAPVAQAMTLEDRVGELEASQSLNIWNFSGMLSTRYDNIGFKQDAAYTPPIYSAATAVAPSIPSTATSSTAMPATLAATVSSTPGYLARGLYNSALGQPIMDSKGNYVRMQFQFNADANVSKNVKFYSRMTMTKHMNRWATQGQSSPLLMDVYSADGYGYTNQGPVMMVEKAYADLTVPNTGVVVSFGRIPTTDGPPAQNWDGRARMGTYPMLSYNVPLDGFALTYKLDQYLPSAHKLAVRAIYTPFGSMNIGSPIKANELFDRPTSNGSPMDNQNSIIAGQLDYNLADSFLAKNTNLILQYLKTGPLGFNYGIDARFPALNQSGVAMANPTDLEIDFSWTTASLDLQKLFGTDFDLSLSYMMSKLNSRGTMYAPMIYNSSATPIYFYLPIGGFGNMNTTTGLGSDASFDGNIMLISGKYRLWNTTMGAEYLAGSQDVFYFNAAAEDLTRFYTTPGTAYHAYVTQHLSENLSWRFGYMQQNQKYTGVYYGRPSADLDRKITTMYTNLRLDF